eukprot:INCI16069.1.p1 GENE.INCI16069.1~~INCI16069.1.p1  ORF type:complete len:514 (-),score=67.34 INCI16069.1:293-1834(-)
MAKPKYRQRIEAVLAAIDRSSDHLPAAYYIRQFNDHVEQQRLERMAANQEPSDAFPRGFFPLPLLKKLVHEAKLHHEEDDRVRPISTEDLRFFFTNLDTDQKGELVMRRSWPWHSSVDGTGILALHGRTGDRFFLRATEPNSLPHGMHGETYVRDSKLLSTARNMAAWMLQWQMFDVAMFRTAAGKAFKTVENMLAHQLMDFSRHSRLCRGARWTPVCTHLRPVVLQGRTKSTGTLLFQPVVIREPDKGGLTFVSDGAMDGPTHLLPTSTLSPIPPEQVQGFLQVEVACAGSFGIDVHLARQVVSEFQLREKLVLLPRAREQQEKQMLHRSSFNDHDDVAHPRKRGRPRKERAANPLKAGTGQRRLIEVERARAQIRRDIHNHRKMSIAARHRHEKVVMVLDQMISSKRLVEHDWSSSNSLTNVSEVSAIVGGGTVTGEDCDQPTETSDDRPAVVGTGDETGEQPRAQEWWTKSVHWAVSELLKLPTFKGNSSRLVGLVRHALETGHVEQPKQ